jgi:predicted transcriptional regulator
VSLLSGAEMFLLISGSFLFLSVTPYELSVRINEDERVVKKILEYLMSKGVLEETKGATDNMYRLKQEVLLDFEKQEFLRFLIEH